MYFCRNHLRQLRAMSQIHQEVYSDASPVLVAVDNIIFGFDPVQEKLKVLIFKRQVAPQKGQWSLIGSFIKQDESGDHAAQRILKQFTGLTNVHLEQFGSYSALDRDPGARVISIAYYSVIRISEQDQALVDTYQAQWFDLNSIPTLVTDHNTMVADALITLQERVARKPIGFDLLPKLFTIPKLLSLYQEIYQTDIDDRNFRKKILATGYLERLDQKDKSTSKKGAFYYQFNRAKYFELRQKGIPVQFV